MKKKTIGINRMMIQLLHDFVNAFGFGFI